MRLDPRYLMLLVFLALAAPAVAPCETAVETPATAPAPTPAGAPQPPPRIQQTVLVVASREEQPSFDVPRSTGVVDAQRLAAVSPVSALDAATGLPGVWIEKRTTTTSDPVIRGMSGVHVLAMVGEGTLSTLWGEGGEGGDDMYGKLDPWSLERIEIIRGPGSVLYGPNALSGILNFVPKAPPLPFVTQGVRQRLQVHAQLGSNYDERRGRVEHALATEHYRSLLGVTWARFGDAHDGAGRRLKPSDGRQLFADYAGELDLHRSRLLRARLQLADLDDTKRYYRPDQTNFNNRFGASLELSQESRASFIERYSARAYYQYKRDRRLFPDERNLGTATTKTLALDLELGSRIASRHRLTYGVQAEADFGICPDDEQFAYERLDGSLVKDGPDSTWGFLGAFAQDEIRLAKAATLVVGGRAERFRFHSTVDQAYLAGAPEGEDRTHDAITDGRSVWAASAGLLVDVAPGLRAFANLGRGYHVAPPSFGLLQLASGIKAPGGLLEPETSWSYELGLKAQGSRLAAALTLYRTDYRDFVDTLPGVYQGQDWYDWNQDGQRQDNEGVVVATNVGRARMTGIEAEALLKLGRGFEASGTLDSAQGDDLTAGTPLRYGTPLRGTLRLAYRAPGGRYGIEAASQLVDRFDRAPDWILPRDPTYRLDPQDTASPLLRPDGRVPGYTLWHLRGDYALKDGCLLRAGVENITAKTYRAVHSRMDGIGRNFWIALEWRLSR